MKNIKNKLFGEAMKAFENERAKQKRNQIPVHSETTKDRLCRQRRSYTTLDEVCVNGKTYPLLHMFAINAPQTAYEKLLNFLY